MKGEERWLSQVWMSTRLHCLLGVVDVTVLVIGCGLRQVVQEVAH